MVRARPPTIYAYQGVIFGMTPDPEPKHAVGSIHSEGTMMKPDASRQEHVDFLEVKGGMFRVSLEKKPDLRAAGRELARPGSSARSQRPLGESQSAI